MQQIIRISTADENILKELSAECYALNSNIDENYCQRFIIAANNADKIVLFYGETALKTCKHFNADGIITDLGEDNLKEKMATLRKELGKNKFIGLFTRSRKHESMLISELEPDFIIFKIYKDGFENLKQLTDWYQEFFIIQSAAWIMDEDIDIQSLNTDFIIK